MNRKHTESGFFRLNNATKEFVEELRKFSATIRFGFVWALVLMCGCDFFAGRLQKDDGEKGGDESLLRDFEFKGDPLLYVETRVYMGNLFRIIVAVDGVPENKPGQKLSHLSVEFRERAAEACRKAYEEIATVERLMSSRLKDSQISLMNRQSLKDLKAGKENTGPFEVDDDVLLVIREAAQVSRLSNGAFDLTFAVAGDLWYDREKREIKTPSEQEQKEILSRVDYRKLLIDLQKRTVRMAAGQQLGLGGIIKGYALDRAAFALRNEGFKNFVVYSGGDVYVSGRYPDKSWRVGIQHPRKKGEYFAVLDFANVAVVTTGDYEGYSELDGNLYPKVLNPRTGRPVDGMRSVTVISDRAVYSDAMSTALFVMGTDEGRRLVDRLSDTEAVFVDLKNKVVVTSGLKNHIRMLEPL